MLRRRLRRKMMVMTMMLLMLLLLLRLMFRWDVVNDAIRRRFEESQQTRH